MSALPDKCTCIPINPKGTDLAELMDFIDIPEKVANVFCPIHGDFKSPLEKLKPEVKKTIWEKIKEMIK